MRDRVAELIVGPQDAIERIVLSLGDPVVLVARVGIGLMIGPDRQVQPSKLVILVAGGLVLRIGQAGLHPKRIPGKRGGLVEPIGRGDLAPQRIVGVRGVMVLGIGFDDQLTDAVVGVLGGVIQRVGRLDQSIYRDWSAFAISEKCLTPMPGGGAAPVQAASRAK